MSSTTSNAPDDRQLALLQAAARGNETRVRALLNETLWGSRMDQNALRHSLQKVAARGNLSLARALIDKGAEVNPAGNEVGALIKAAESGNAQLVRVMLGTGSMTMGGMARVRVDVDARDKNSRTALYAAAWAGHLVVVRSLLDARADVDARDIEKRTPLIHLAAEKPGRWTIQMVELLLERGADVEAVDGTKRTALLWASATGKSEVVGLLLSGTRAPKANVAATNNRGKTALQLAAENNHEDIVAMLLDAGADASATSDGQWTALHNAAEKGHTAIVRRLLNTSFTDVNAETSSGMTALHWAAQNGHIEIVQELMNRPEIMLSNKDTFNSTPMLRAAEKGHLEIVHMLSPYRFSQRLEDAAKKACQGFEATVVDFGVQPSEKNVEHRKGQLVYKHSVYDLLYGWDSKNDKPLVNTLTKNIKSKPAFRWIHLPANNISWVETLLTKSFVEGGARDVDDFKALEKCFGQEHHGPKVHAHFMRTFCQRLATSMLMKHSGGPEQARLLPPLPPAPPPDSQPPPGPKQGRTPPPPPRGPLPEAQSSRDPKPVIEAETPSKAERKRGKKDKQQAHETPKNNNSPAPGGRRNGQGPRDRPPPNLRTESRFSDGRHGKIVLFMPYLHYETDNRREKMARVVNEVDTQDFRPIASRNTSPDENLVQAYLKSSPRMHIRRTLDQFFYHGIDTRERDRDQVVWRYCKNNKMEKKLFMVDQLWCWVLGQELIITCFPQRWDQPKNDPLNVLDGIIEDINSKTRPPVTSVYDLAMLITGRCSGVFDRHRLGHSEYQFLDMFDTSIGDVTNRETKLFRRFNRASQAAAAWVKKLKLDEYRVDDGMFVDALLDIDVETELLAEIKDIRDELQMIDKVLKEQRGVIPDLADRICEELGGRKSELAVDMQRRSKEQLKIIETHIKDVDRMDKQAEGIYTSLTHLLDLKQKHANAMEARVARNQAQITARQGQTIMVFTIVTIVFLPLSFMAAFFTIEINEFPHGNNGSPGLPLGWVSKYLFGIGLAVSVPLIALALAVEDVATFFRRLFFRGTRLLRRRRTKIDGAASPSDGEELRPARRSRSTRRRRRSDVYATDTDTDSEIKVNGRVEHPAPPRRSAAVESTRERGLDMSPNFAPAIRTRSWRTDLSWGLERLDIRGRASRDTDRFGGIV
ncbi:ankyrin [Rhizodiscina lignyota]|uniref:Ankyrin n=1 Tax=Rhizodiscina lignyota TaxID=1504668 RepID=A0A9P4IBJ3_9PEZI|nr:ankyrin [Rhizodiscina lignyota]